MRLNKLLLLWPPFGIVAPTTIATNVHRVSEHNATLIRHSAELPSTVLRRPATNADTFVRRS